MEKINQLRKLLNNHNLDGYIVPKNDEFFGEYIPENKDKLKFISNFSGSYGFALILISARFKVGVVKDDVAVLTDLSKCL